MWTLFFICTSTFCLELIFKECEIRLHIQFMNTQFLFMYWYTLMLIWCWRQCLRYTWLSFRLYEDTLTYSCRAHTGLSKIGHWYCIVGMFTGTNLQSSMHIICVALFPGHMPYNKASMIKATKTAHTYHRNSPIFCFVPDGMQCHICCRKLVTVDLVKNKYV